MGAGRRWSPGWTRRRPRSCTSRRRRRCRSTAIYCTDNVLSAGAFAAVQDSGLHCPQDLSLIGFDDHEWSTLVRPRLTVVEQPTEAIGVAAAEDLLDAIAEPTRPPVTRLLSAHLVVRDSTAPPPGLNA